MSSSFECSICKNSITSGGPDLKELSFASLFECKNGDDYEEIVHEFPGFAQFFKPEGLVGIQPSTYKKADDRPEFDCSRPMVTLCGHFYHSGCLREWFYTCRHLS